MRLPKHFTERHNYILRVIDHFRKLNNISSHTDVSPFPSDTSPTTNNDVINQPFTVDEIKAGIKLLKNNKSGGAENMINEFFKHCHIDCIINIVLYTCLVPTEWCLVIINPIYKKGLPSDANTYREISLLRCTCTLFTACINKRLSDYVQPDIIGE